MIFINKEIVYVPAFGKNIKIGDEIKFGYSEHTYTVQAINGSILDLKFFNTILKYSIFYIEEVDQLIEK